MLVRDPRRTHSRKIAPTDTHICHRVPNVALVDGKRLAGPHGNTGDFIIGRRDGGRTAVA